MDRVDEILVYTHYCKAIVREAEFHFLNFDKNIARLVKRSNWKVLENELLWRK